MSDMKSLIALLITLMIFSNLHGQSEFDLNCFSILVGKKASTDGSVFFAHNEDGGVRKNLLNYIKSQE